MQDIALRSTLIIELYHIVLELVGRIHEARFEGKTLTLKVKYADFSVVSKRATSAAMLTSKTAILPLAKRLLAQVAYSAVRPIRLLGLSVSNPLSETDLRAHPEWMEGELEFEEP